MPPSRGGSPAAVLRFQVRQMGVCGKDDRTVSLSLSLSLSGFSMAFVPYTYIGPAGYDGHIRVL